MEQAKQRNSKGDGSRVGEGVRAKVGPEPLLLNITQASRVLGLSRTTVHRLLDTGELRYRRVLGGDRRVPRSECVRFANSGLIGVEPK